MFAITRYGDQNIKFNSIHSHYDELNTTKTLGQNMSATSSELWLTTLSQLRRLPRVKIADSCLFLSRREIPLYSLCHDDARPRLVPTQCWLPLQELQRAKAKMRKKRIFRHGYPKRHAIPPRKFLCQLQRNGFMSLDLEPVSGHEDEEDDYADAYQHCEE